MLDPRRALHERLDDHRGDLLGVEVEHAFELVGVTGLHPVGAKEQGRVGGVEGVDAADRDRAQRVAVIGVAKRDEAGAAGVLAAALPPVLEGHLERDLGRAGARVRIEDPAEAGRGELDQPGGQLRGALVGQPQHGRMRDPVELLVHGAVDQRWRWPWTLHHSDETPSM